MKIKDENENELINWMDKLKEKFQDEGFIAILDDELSIQKFVSYMLEPTGINTLKFTYANDFKNAIRKREQRILLLITDTWIPEDRGIPIRDWIGSDKIYAELVGEFPDLKVLYISGHSFEEVNKIHGVKCPVSLFLGKPFSKQELAAKVYEIISS